MATTRFVRENRFHAPLVEKMEDELLLAIRKNHQDAGECRRELIRRGWTDAWFVQVGI